MTRVGSQLIEHHTAQPTLHIIDCLLYVSVSTGNLRVDIVPTEQTRRLVGVQIVHHAVPLRTTVPAVFVPTRHAVHVITPAVFLDGLAAARALSRVFTNPVVRAIVNAALKVFTRLLVMPGPAVTEAHGLATATAAHLLGTKGVYFAMPTSATNTPHKTGVVAVTSHRHEISVAKKQNC